MNAPTRPVREAAASTFERRHIGPSAREIDAMLEAVGVRSMAELIAQTIPDEIRTPRRSRSTPRSRKRRRWRDCASSPARMLCLPR